MLSFRGFCPGASLLVLLVVGCSSDLVEPTENLTSTAASGPKVNAPSSTNASAVSHDRIDVSWQDNSGNETGFELHRSTTGVNGAFTLRTSTAAGSTNYSDWGLTPSSEYCYKVRAFRTTGSKTSYSAFSTTGCATTLAPPVPAAASGANAWPEGSTAIVLNWTDNSWNENGFRVERSLDLGASWTTAGGVGPTQYYPFFFDSDRTPEQPVCYRVIAFNDGGDSPPSNTDCTAPPAGPTNLTAASINPDWIEIELTWSDNSQVEDGYQVEMFVWNEYDYGGGYWWTIDNLEANSIRYTTSSYIGGPYRVVATKDGGYSDYSNEATPQF